MRSRARLTLLPVGTCKRVGVPAKFYILLGLVTPLSNNFLKRESQPGRQDFLAGLFSIFFPYI